MVIILARILLRFISYKTVFTNYELCIDGNLNLRLSLRFERRLGTWYMIWNSNSWSKSSGEKELEEEVESQEVEEVELVYNYNGHFQHNFPHLVPVPASPKCTHR